MGDKTQAREFRVGDRVEYINSLGNGPRGVVVRMYRDDVVVEFYNDASGDNPTYCVRNKDLKHMSELDDQMETSEVMVALNKTEVLKQEIFEGMHGHSRFYDLLIEMGKIHSIKNHDYCPGDDPLGNFKTSAVDAGVPAWVGVLIRVGDKVSRLRSFAKKGRFKVNDESVTDTFMDLAIYGLLGLLCYEEKEDG